MGKRGPSSKFGSGSKVCRMPIAIANDPDEFLLNLGVLIMALRYHSDNLHPTSPRDAKMRRFFSELGNTVENLRVFYDV